MTIVAADPAPIDFDHLARQTFADHALERELLELFAAQCDALVPAIGDARRPQDGVMAAHTLKGSARAVGAWALAAFRPGRNPAWERGYGRRRDPDGRCRHRSPGRAGRGPRGLDCSLTEERLSLSRKACLKERQDQNGFGRSGGPGEGSM